MSRVGINIPAQIKTEFITLGRFEKIKRPFKHPPAAGEQI